MSEVVIIDIIGSSVKERLIKKTLEDYSSIKRYYYKNKKEIKNKFLFFKFYKQTRILVLEINESEYVSELLESKKDIKKALRLFYSGSFGQTFDELEIIYI